MKASKTIISLIVVALLTGCTTSPTGRSQMKIFPESKMDQMGAQSFEALKKETKVDTNKAHQAFVQCVTDALIPSLPPKYANEQWEVVVFVDKSPNAFALPGRKIGVNTGMIELVADQNELAVVLGHELAHVVAGHGNERMSTQMATELGINLIAASAGSSAGLNADRTAALLGAGAQLGLLLPFSRTQESEADKMGLIYMANAGFNPQASITLWNKMAGQGKEKPEFLQTHPASKNRVKQFETWMFEAESDYNFAKRSGKVPHCAK